MAIPKRHTHTHTHTHQQHTSHAAPSSNSHNSRAAEPRTIFFYDGQICDTCARPHVAEGVSSIGNGESTPVDVVDLTITLTPFRDHNGPLGPESEPGGRP